MLTRSKKYIFQTLIICSVTILSGGADAIALHTVAANRDTIKAKSLIKEDAGVNAKEFGMTAPVSAVLQGPKRTELPVAEYAWGEELDGLRMGISQVKRPEQNNYDKPRFHVALQNVGKKDLVLNLGIMLANGKEQYSTAVKLIFTDPNGKSYEFHNNTGRHPGIAGRVDPFLVPLAAGCTYVLRVDFNNYWLVPVGASLPKGRYRVMSVFEGKAVNHTNLDIQGIGLMLYWTGTIKSKEFLFKNLCGGPVLQKPDLVVSKEPKKQKLLRNHTKWISECLKRIQSIKPGATRGELLEVFTTEGGISTRSWRTYVYRECPYIKVDVEFKAVDDDKWDEKPGDVITKISKPYLEWSIMN